MRKTFSKKLLSFAMAGALCVSTLSSAGAASAKDGFLARTGNGSADSYVYVYAGLNWSEYWANEPVYNAGDATSSSAVDIRGEHDLGGFDAVSRATTNHGLHRGSYQTEAVIYDTEGNAYNVSYWTTATHASSARRKS